LREDEYSWLIKYLCHISLDDVRHFNRLPNTCLTLGGKDASSFNEPGL